MMIVCTECKQQLDMSKMGVWVVHHDDAGDVNKVYRADMYECRTDGFHVLADFGKAILPDNHPGFKRLVTAIMNEEYFTILDAR